MEILDRFNSMRYYHKTSIKNFIVGNHTGLRQYFISCIRREKKKANKYNKTPKWGTAHH